MTASPLTTAYVALGSNVGDRPRHLAGAVTGLGRRSGVEVVRASPVYETVAHTLDPADRQAPYLNAVVEVRTTLEAPALLAACHAIEHAAGRDRRGEPRWAPRTLDLDLLLYGRQTSSTPALNVPHPRMAERRFVLRPLADLAPGLWVPPPMGCTVQALLDACPDDDEPVRTDLVLAAP